MIVMLCKFSFTKMSAEVAAAINAP